MRIAILVFALVCTTSLFSQTNIPITGPSPVGIASQQTYVADLSGVTQTPGSVVTWSVAGGTIVSAITDPTAASVYCVVRWSYRPDTYTLGASINAPAQSGSKQVVVQCVPANAGSDVSICTGDSIQIGTPAVPAHSSYTWRIEPGINNNTIAQPFVRPTQTTNYRLTVFSQSPNLLQNGNFANGNTGFGSDYLLYPTTSGTNGTYGLTTNPHLMYADWRNIYTSEYLFIADGAVLNDPSNLRFWYTTVNVQPNNWYQLSFSTTTLVENNICNMRLTFTGNNSGAAVLMSQSNPQYLPSSLSGSGISGLAWYSGSNTQVTIDMRYLPIPNNPTHSNQLGFDNMIFQEFVGCAPTVDTVTVTVGARPAVSPSGPIEYYYLLESGAPQIGITLTSETLPGYQWYKDNVLISGATSQTYKAKSTGVYTVQGAGCPSEGVVFYDHAKGPDDRTIIGEPLDFPGGVHSPTYYCYNTAGYIKQFDLGSSANYYWETYTPGGTTPQLTINPTTYDIHSPQADVNIALPQANPTTVLGYAEDDGFVKAMEYTNFYYSSQSTPLTGTAAICAGTSFSVTNYNSFTSSEINPGASRFNWETYDVGSGGEILVPDPTLYPDPADPTNTKKIRIPGKNGYTGGITVRMNTLPGRIKKYFYTNDGDCYQDSKRYEADPGCRMSVTSQVSLFPNPAKNSVTITSSDDILSVEVSGLTSPVSRPVIQKNAGTKTLTLNLAQYKPGVYNCKIITTGGVVNEKLIVSP